MPAELDFVRINTQGGHDSVFYAGMGATRWRKFANGRVYMAGARSPNPQAQVRIYGQAHEDLYERLAKQNITLWEYWGPEIELATRRLAAFDPRSADNLHLADHLEDTIAAARRHWMVHTMGGARPIRPKEVIELYAHLTGRDTETAAREVPFLLIGAETVQTRLVQILYNLACLAQASPTAAKQMVLAGEIDEGFCPPELESFKLALRSLLEDYGSRLTYQQVPGFPAALPLPWRETPDYVWNLIASYLPQAAQGGRDPHDISMAARRDVDEQIEVLCLQAVQNGVEPGEIAKFRSALAYARRNAAFLDEHNHYIDQLSEGQYIQALLYSGSWLAENGVLPGRFDVVWLTSDEVLDVLRHPQAGLAQLLDERRAQFVKWQSLIAPACMGPPGTELPGRTRQEAASLTAEFGLLEQQPNSLRGEPASRGHVAGRAHILRGERLPVDLSPGDVLIAPYARLELIPYLPAAAALVLDYGNPGDHFAITVREFALPSVCATLDATRKIPDGAWVTVNGDEGLIDWEEPG